MDKIPFLPVGKLRLYRNGAVTDEETVPGEYRKPKIPMISVTTQTGGTRELNNPLAMSNVGKRTFARPLKFRSNHSKHVTLSHTSLKLSKLPFARQIIMSISIQHHRREGLQEGLGAGGTIELFFYLVPNVVIA